MAVTCSVSAVAASTPRIVSSTGSGFGDHVAAPRTMSRSASTGTLAPSSSPLAWAPRTRDSAAASGIRLRNAWCHRSRVQASRASSTCSGMPGSSASRATAATIGLSVGTRAD